VTAAEATPTGTVGTAELAIYTTPLTAVFGRKEMPKTTGNGSQQKF